MNFYKEWSSCIQNKENDFQFISAFLRREDKTKIVFKSGTSSQIELLCNFLLNYDINKMIEVLDYSFYNYLTSDMIVQFSNFEHGTVKLVELLYSKEEGMTYSEIGRALVHSEKAGAATKYGENHSKLAKGFGLVTISDHKPSVVNITNFGKYFAFFDKIVQIKIIGILCIRDPLVQNLLIKAKHGIVYYDNECKCLSESTRVRRRSNVKKLIEMVLENADVSIGNNIMW